MSLPHLFIIHVLSWITILASIIIALALSTVNPDFHPFCLLDLSISYPNRDPKISVGLFLFLSIVLPVVAIVVVSLSFPPKAAQRDPQQHWARKLRELNTGLLGLGMSLATATIIVTGVKNLTGKPRPDFLARCQPDLKDVSAYTVGGVGQTFSPLWVLVDQEICQQPDKKWLNDGFRSFPSGYATISFAGLYYLILYLCLKFEIVLPGIPINDVHLRNHDDKPLMLSSTEASSEDRDIAIAKPTFLLPLPYIPLGLAIFISGTRYFDFTNHAFDVLTGAAIGACTAWSGFKWYLPALLEHTGAAWGERRIRRERRG